jgi:hypothetical protein
MYYWNKPVSKTQWEQPKAPAVALPTPLPKAPRYPASAPPDAEGGGWQDSVTASKADCGGGTVASGDSQGAAAAVQGAGAEDARGGVVKMELDSNGADAAEGGAQGKPAAASFVKRVVRNAEARIVPSPYEDRYLCPIFGCWRSIQNAEQSGAVKYYGK